MRSRMDRQLPANAPAQPHTLVGAPSAFDAPSYSHVRTNADVAFRAVKCHRVRWLTCIRRTKIECTRAVQVLMLGLHMRLPPAKRLAHAHMIARAARERTSSISQRLCLSLHLPPRRVFRALNSPDCLVAFFAEAVSRIVGLGAVSSPFVAAVRVTHKTRPRTIVYH
jgi:hypothetical protein